MKQLASGMAFGAVLFSPAVIVSVGHAYEIDRFVLGALVVGSGVVSGWLLAVCGVEIEWRTKTER